MNKDTNIVDPEAIILSKKEAQELENVKVFDKVTPELHEAITICYRHYELTQSNIYSEMATSLRKKCKELMDNNTKDPKKQSVIMKALNDAAKSIEKLEQLAKGTDTKSVSKMTDNEIYEKLKKQSS